MIAKRSAIPASAIGLALTVIATIETALPRPSKEGPTRVEVDNGKLRATSTDDVPQRHSIRPTAGRRFTLAFAQPVKPWQGVREAYLKNSTSPGKIPEQASWWRERSGVGKRESVSALERVVATPRVAMSAFIPAPCDSQPRCRHLLNALANSGLFLAVKRGVLTGDANRKREPGRHRENFRNATMGGRVFISHFEGLLHVDYRVRYLQRHACIFVQRRLRFAPDS